MFFYFILFFSYHGIPVFLIPEYKTILENIANQPYIMQSNSNNCFGRQNYHELSNNYQRVWAKITTIKFIAWRQSLFKIKRQWRINTYFIAQNIWVRYLVTIKWSWTQQWTQKPWIMRLEGEEFPEQLQKLSGKHFRCMNWIFGDQWNLSPFRQRFEAFPCNLALL